MEHNSITFYTVEDSNGNTVYRYKRNASGESDDGIGYLTRYEGYSFPDAVKALAYFQDESLDDDDCDFSDSTQKLGRLL